MVPEKNDPEAEAGTNNEKTTTTDETSDLLQLEDAYENNDEDNYSSNASSIASSNASSIASSKTLLRRNHAPKTGIETIKEEESGLLTNQGSDNKASSEDDEEIEGLSQRPVADPSMQTIIPSVSDSVNSDIPKKWFDLSPKKKWFVGGFVILIVITSGVLLGILLSKGDKSVKKRPPPATAPTTAPTTIIWDSLLKRLKEDWDASNKDLYKGSPYVKAMEWTLTDPLASSWMDDDDDAAKFDQRFGMTLFYFQMGGDSWTKCSQNETALLQNVTSKNCTAQESSTQNCCTLYDRDEVVMKGNTWLSENHECQWGGIICEGDVVSGLHLNNLKLRGTIPSLISKFTQLKELILMNNEINGRIPTEIGALSKLEAIDLRGNSLKQDIPKELYKLGDLVDLTLGYNELSGTISSAIGNMKSLKVLYLTKNLLSGSIPSEIGSIDLYVLSISQNRFNSTLPAEFKNLINLNTLFLDNNQLSGALQLPIAPDLMNLPLKQNSFSGALPDNLYKLTNLRYLNANNNKFTGTLSPDIGNLSHLMYLTFRENNLKGPVPKEIAKLADLETLQLHRNNFSGIVPPSICDLRELTTFETDCQEDLINDLPAEVSCGCCTICCDPMDTCSNVID